METDENGNQRPGRMSKTWNDVRIVRWRKCGDGPRDIELFVCRTIEFCEPVPRKEVRGGSSEEAAPANSLMAPKNHYTVGNLEAICDKPGSPAFGERSVYLIRVREEGGKIQSTIPMVPPKAVVRKWRQDPSFQ